MYKRQALQNDGFVQKISEYISKKVADKLTGMCKTDRESYEKYWDDISPFIKYGCIKDAKFAEKMGDYVPVSYTHLICSAGWKISDSRRIKTVRSNYGYHVIYRRNNCKTQFGP